MKARDSHRLVLAMLFLPATAGAALIPSFDLESRTWDATHIVVVTEAEKIDGEVRVLESWKGELERGDLLVLKELASFASKESRRIGGWLGFEESDECVTGARMVCFLTKSGDTWQSAGGKDWRPAMEISVAWIDHGTVYARVQIMNPGGLVLTSQGTETEVRNSVLRILKTRSELFRIQRIPDRSSRARALGSFLTKVRTTSYQGRESALRELGECGEEALPTLRRIMDDPDLLEFHPQIVGIMAKTAGESAGPYFVQLTREELRFWKEKAPDLKRGWWNGSRDDLEMLRNRYSIVTSLLGAFARIGFAGCRDVVRETRDLWRSVPALKEVGHDQIGAACDGVLRRWTSK